MVIVFGRLYGAQFSTNTKKETIQENYLRARKIISADLRTYS